MIDNQKSKQKRQAQKEERRKLKEYGESQHLSLDLTQPSDITSIDQINAADTTAFPTYIDEKGKVTHAERTVVGEEVFSEEDEYQRKREAKLKKLTKKSLKKGGVKSAKSKSS